MNLLDELQEHVVCGDGAMGTLLLDQGLPMESCLEEVCVSDPDRVRAIHRD
jgi:homocysteine S-methyltransferase